jgi:hypothetical protein
MTTWELVVVLYGVGVINAMLLPRKASWEAFGRWKALISASSLWGPPVNVLTLLTALYINPEGEKTLHLRHAVEADMGVRYTWLEPWLIHFQAI